MIRQGEELGIQKSDEWRKRRKDSFADLESLERWITHILESCLQEQARAEEKSYSDKVRRALAYMREEYAAPLTSEEICAYLDISESHFRRIFREEVGMKPMEYLNKYRIEQAKKLLKSGHNKVQDVYAQVGFSSSQYFSKVFKKITGESPWQYQQKGGDRG